MYSGADSTGHVSVTTSKGKVTAVFHQKSPGSMETHWEEDAGHSTKHDISISKRFESR